MGNMSHPGTPGAALDDGDVTKLIQLFNFNSKRELIRFCRNLIITKAAFANLLLGGRLGLVPPYRYACHFAELSPKHLKPTEEELSAMSAAKVGPLQGKARKLMTKITQTFRERRLFAAHLFHTPGKRYWHLFYFDQRDRADTRNHWRHGPHIHFVNDHFVSAPLDTIWARVTAGDTRFLPAIHIRYNDSRDRHLYVGSLRKNRT